MMRKAKSEQALRSSSASGRTWFQEHHEGVVSAFHLFRVGLGHAGTALRHDSRASLSLHSTNPSNFSTLEPTPPVPEPKRTQKP